MATDGSGKNGGGDGNDPNDPVNDLFDAIQTVHDRRVREETQTALLRRPNPTPKVRIGWIAAIGFSAITFFALAGWMISHFQSTGIDMDKTALDSKGKAPQPSAGSEPWAERASPIPAYQAPPSAPQHHETHLATPSPSAPISTPSARPAEHETRSFQEEAHPADVRTRPAAPPQEPDPYDDPEEEAPGHKDLKKLIPPGEGESEGFFE